MKLVAIDNYRVISKVVKTFIKKGYFANFSSNNLFYFVDEKNEIICSFVDNFGNDVFGIPFYFGSDGINCVIDMIDTESDYATSITDHCCTNVMICKKEALLPEEEEFIHAMGLNITKENNIVIRTFKKGYPSRIANNDEAIVVLRALDYLKCVIENEIEDLPKAFKENKISKSFFDNSTMEYQSFYDSKIPAFKKYRKESFSLDVYNEFKSFKRIPSVGELVTKNLTVPVLDSYDEAILPLALSFAIDEALVKLQAITSSPKHYKNYILGFLEEIFSMEGIPQTIYVNERKLYYSFVNLFTKLGINFIFRRENEAADEMLYNLDTSITSYFKSSINDTVAILASEFSSVFKMAENIVDSGELNDDDSDDDSFSEDMEENLDEASKKYVS